MAALLGADADEEELHYLGVAPVTSTERLAGVVPCLKLEKSPTRTSTRTYLNK